MQLNISTTLQHFLHTKQPFDSSFSVSQLSHHYLNIWLSSDPLHHLLQPMRFRRAYAASLLKKQSSYSSKAEVSFGANSFASALLLTTSPNMVRREGR